MNIPPAPPPGTAWAGEWDADYGDRIYGTDPIAIGNTAALLTGIQHLNGTTVSGIALRIQGVTLPDLWFPRDRGGFPMPLPARSWIP